MNVYEYAASQLDLNQTTTPTYTRDYVGAVQMLEDSGFSPFAQTSPLDSTLTQIFDRFVQKTGLGTDSNTLKNEYLDENPAMQRAMNLYDSLENTFAGRGAGEKAAIVDFLNTKIDEYFENQDENSDSTLTLEESDFTETLFEEADANRDAQLSTEEVRNNFYQGFQQLNNVLDYFRNTRGNLVDIYG
jgi:hypothetical protein